MDTESGGKASHQARGLALAALAAGLLSFALTIVYGHLATSGMLVVARHADWHAYAFWADMAHFAALIFAVLGWGLFAGACYEHGPAGRWTAGLVALVALIAATMSSCIMV